MCPVKGEIVIVVSSVWRVHCGVSVTHTCTQNIGFISSYCDRLHYSVDQWHYSKASAERQNWKIGNQQFTLCPVLFYFFIRCNYMEQSQRKECLRVPELVKMDMTAVLFTRCILFQPWKAWVKIFSKFRLTSEINIILKVKTLNFLYITVYFVSNIFLLMTWHDSHMLFIQCENIFLVWRVCDVTGKHLNVYFSETAPMLYIN